MATSASQTLAPRAQQPGMPYEHVKIMICEHEDEIVIEVPESFFPESLEIVAQNFRVAINADLSIFQNRETMALRLMHLRSPATMDIDQFEHFADFKNGKMCRVMKINIPPPRSRWMLYRKDKAEEVSAFNRSMSPSEISVLVSRMWRSETPAVIRRYTMMADLEKRRHRSKYPAFRHVPRYARPRKEKLAQARNTHQGRNIAMLPDAAEILAAGGGATGENN